MADSAHPSLVAALVPPFDRLLQRVGGDDAKITGDGC